MARGRKKKRIDNKTKKRRPPKSRSLVSSGNSLQSSQETKCLSRKAKKGKRKLSRAVKNKTQEPSDHSTIAVEKISPLSPSEHNGRTGVVVHLKTSKPFQNQTALDNKQSDNTDSPRETVAANKTESCYTKPHVHCDAKLSDGFCKDPIVLLTYARCFVVTHPALARTVLKDPRFAKRRVLKVPLSHFSELVDKLCSKCRHSLDSPGVGACRYCACQDLSRQTRVVLERIKQEDENMKVSGQNGSGEMHASEIATKKTPTTRCKRDVNGNIKDMYGKKILNDNDSPINSDTKSDSHESIALSLEKSTIPPCGRIRKSVSTDGVKRENRKLPPLTISRKRIKIFSGGDEDDDKTPEYPLTHENFFSSFPPSAAHSKSNGDTPSSDNNRNLFSEMYSSLSHSSFKNRKTEQSVKPEVEHKGDTCNGQQQISPKSPGSSTGSPNARRVTLPSEALKLPKNISPVQIPRTGRVRLFPKSIPNSSQVKDEVRPNEHIQKYETKTSLASVKEFCDQGNDSVREESDRNNEQIPQLSPMKEDSCDLYMLPSPQCSSQPPILDLICDDSMTLCSTKDEIGAPVWDSQSGNSTSSIQLKLSFTTPSSESQNCLVQSAAVKEEVDTQDVQMPEKNEATTSTNSEGTIKDSERKCSESVTPDRSSSQSSSPKETSDSGDLNSCSETHSSLESPQTRSKNDSTSQQLTASDKTTSSEVTSKSCEHNKNNSLTSISDTNIIESGPSDGTIDEGQTSQIDGSKVPPSLIETILRSTTLTMQCVVSSSGSGIDIRVPGKNVESVTETRPDVTVTPPVSKGAEELNEDGSCSESVSNGQLNSVQDSVVDDQQDKLSAGSLTSAAKDDKMSNSTTQNSISLGSPGKESALQSDSILINGKSTPSSASEESKPQDTSSLAGTQPAAQVSMRISEIFSLQDWSLCSPPIEIGTTEQNSQPSETDDSPKVPSNRLAGSPLEERKQSDAVSASSTQPLDNFPHGDGPEELDAPIATSEPVKATSRENATSETEASVRNCISTEAKEIQETSQQETTESSIDIPSNHTILALPSTVHTRNESPKLKWTSDYYSSNSTTKKPVKTTETECPKKKFTRNFQYIIDQATSRPGSVSPETNDTAAKDEQKQTKTHQKSKREQCQTFDGVTSNDFLSPDDSKHAAVPAPSNCVVGMTSSVSLPQQAPKSSINLSQHKIVTSILSSPIVDTVYSVSSQPTVIANLKLSGVHEKSVGKNYNIRAATCVSIEQSTVRTPSNMAENGRNAGNGCQQALSRASNLSHQNSVTCNRQLSPTLVRSECGHNKGMLPQLSAPVQVLHRLAHSPHTNPYESHVNATTNLQINQELDQACSPSLASSISSEMLGIVRTGKVDKRMEIPSNQIQTAVPVPSGARKSQEGVVRNFPAQPPVARMPNQPARQAMWRPDLRSEIPYLVPGQAVNINRLIAPPAPVSVSPSHVRLPYPYMNEVERPNRPARPVVTNPNSFPAAPPAPQGPPTPFMDVHTRENMNFGRHMYYARMAQMPKQNHVVKQTRSEPEEDIRYPAWVKVPEKNSSNDKTKASQKPMANRSKGTDLDSPHAGQLQAQAFPQQKTCQPVDRPQGPSTVQHQLPNESWRVSLQQLSSPDQLISHYGSQGAEQGLSKGENQMVSPVGRVHSAPLADHEDVSPEPLDLSRRAQKEAPVVVANKTSPGTLRENFSVNGGSRTESRRASQPETASQKEPAAPNKVPPQPSAQNGFVRDDSRTGVRCVSLPETSAQKELTAVASMILPPTSPQNLPVSSNSPARTLGVSQPETAIEKEPSAAANKLLPSASPQNLSVSCDSRDKGWRVSQPKMAARIEPPVVTNRLPPPAVPQNLPMGDDGQTRGGFVSQVEASSNSYQAHCISAVSRGPSEENICENELSQLHGHHSDQTMAGKEPMQSPRISPTNSKPATPCPTHPEIINTIPINTIPINTIPINTVPINTVPINTVPNTMPNTMPINTVPINTMPINTVPNTMPINTVPINTIPINTIPINTIPINVGLVTRNHGAIGQESVHVCRRDVSQFDNSATDRHSQESARSPIMSSTAPPTPIITMSSPLASDVQHQTISMTYEVTVSSSPQASVAVSSIHSDAGSCIAASATSCTTTLSSLSSNLTVESGPQSARRQSLTYSDISSASPRSGLPSMESVADSENVSVHVESVDKGQASSKVVGLPVKDFFTSPCKENTYSSLVMAQILAKNKRPREGSPVNDEIFTFEQSSRNNTNSFEIDNRLQKNLIIDLTDADEDCDVVSVSSNDEDDTASEFLDLSRQDKVPSSASVATCSGITDVTATQSEEPGALPSTNLLSGISDISAATEPCPDIVDDGDFNSVSDCATDGRANLCSALLSTGTDIEDASLIYRQITGPNHYQHQNKEDSVINKSSGNLQGIFSQAGERNRNINASAAERLESQGLLPTKNVEPSSNLKIVPANREIMARKLKAAVTSREPSREEPPEDLVLSPTTVDTPMTHPVTTVTHPMTTVTHPVTTVTHPITTLTHPICSMTHSVTTMTHPITTVTHPITTLTHPITIVTYPNTIPMTTQTVSVSSVSHSVTTMTHPIGKEVQLDQNAIQEQEHDNSTQRAAATLLELSSNPLYNNLAVSPETSDSYQEKVYQVHPTLGDDASNHDDNSRSQGGVRQDAGPHRGRTGRRVGRPPKDQDTIYTTATNDAKSSSASGHTRAPLSTAQAVTTTTAIPTLIQIHQSPGPVAASTSQTIPIIPVQNFNGGRNFHVVPMIICPQGPPPALLRVPSQNWQQQYLGVSAPAGQTPVRFDPKIAQLMNFRPHNPLRSGKRPEGHSESAPEAAMITVSQMDSAPLAVSREVVGQATNRPQGISTTVPKQSQTVDNVNVSRTPDGHTTIPANSIIHYVPASGPNMPVSQTGLILSDDSTPHVTNRIQEPYSMRPTEYNKVYSSSPVFNMGEPGVHSNIPVQTGTRFTALNTVVDVPGEPSPRRRRTVNSNRGRGGGDRQGRKRPSADQSEELPSEAQPLRKEQRVSVSNEDEACLRYEEMPTNKTSRDRGKSFRSSSGQSVDESECKPMPLTKHPRDCSLQELIQELSSDVPSPDELVAMSREENGVQVFSLQTRAEVRSLQTKAESRRRNTRGVKSGRGRNVKSIFPNAETKSTEAAQAIVAAHSLLDMQTFADFEKEKEKEVASMLALMMQNKQVKAPAHGDSRRGCRSVSQTRQRSSSLAHSIVEGRTCDGL